MKTIFPFISLAALYAATDRPDPPRPSDFPDLETDDWRRLPYRAYGGGYAAPPRPSGVAIPDHSARRIAAAEAKRQRKNKTRQP